MSEMLGEGEQPPIPGEGQTSPREDTALPITQEIKDKKLSFEEASRSLKVLGKDESGIRYAYLMMSLMNRSLTDVSVILNFKHVLFLDLSGNYLTLDDLQVLVDMPFLILLKVDRNKVESAALGYMPYLQVLSFNQNKIIETNDIYQPLLDSLELHYNFICNVQFNVEGLKNLKQLEMRSNHLLDLSGTFPTSLERLYLARNQIKDINGEDLAKLENLARLHLRDNDIRKLNGFSSSLKHLAYLNLRNNKITKMRQCQKLQCLKALRTLIVIGNPFWPDEPIPTGEEKPEEEAGDEEEAGEGELDNRKIDFRRVSLLVLLPWLTRINKDMVTMDERQLAREIKQDKYLDIMAESSSEEETDMPTTAEPEESMLDDYQIATSSEYDDDEEDEEEDEEENDEEGQSPPPSPINM